MADSDDSGKMHPDTSRSIWIGWGVAVASIGAAYFLGGPHWAFLAVFVGIVIVMRGHFPSLFKRSLLSWPIALLIVIICTVSASWFYSQYQTHTKKEPIISPTVPSTTLPATTSTLPSTTIPPVIPKQSTIKEQKENAVKELPTLKKLFDKDFANLMRRNANRQLIIGNDPTQDVVMIPEKIYLDFAAKTKFVGYFIPFSTPCPYCICEFLSEMPKETIKDFDLKGEVQFGHSTEVRMTSSKDLIFSGRVYIYHEDNFSLQQLAALERIYESKGLSVLFRSTAYLQMMSGQKFKELEQEPKK
jgi:hypothetical protein